MAVALSETHMINRRLYQKKCRGALHRRPRAFPDHVWRFGVFRVLRVVLQLSELRAHRRAAGNGDVAVRNDGPQRAEFSSRRRHGRLPRTAGGAVRRLFVRFHRPGAAAGPGPPQPVPQQGAGAERRRAGDDHGAAQVSGVTTRKRSAQPPLGLLAPNPRARGALGDLTDPLEPAGRRFGNFV